MSKLHLVKVTDNFTRPANTTNYANGDQVSNNETAGSVVPMTFNINGGFRIWGIKLKKSGTTVANSALKLHFWTTATSIVPTAGDNAAFAQAQAPTDGYIGNVTLPVTTAGTDGAVAYDDNITDSLTEPAIISGFVDGQSRLYCIAAATAAYNPDSAEVFTLELYYESL